MLVGSMCAMQPYKGKGVAKDRPRSDEVACAARHQCNLIGPGPSAGQGVAHEGAIMCV